MHEEGCSSEHAMVPVEKEKDHGAEFQDLAFPELCDKSNHPKSFLVLKRKFGYKKPTYRSFQPSWFKKWPWLIYNETDDKAFCFVCIKAVLQERVRNCALISKTSDAFLTRGFTNWKDATGEKHGGFPLYECSHVSLCCSLIATKCFA